MVKRPCTVLAAAYLCGIWGAEVNRLWFWLLLLLLWIVTAYLFIRLRSPVFFNRHDKILILLPFLVISGVFSLKGQQASCPLEQTPSSAAVRCTIFGTVEEIDGEPGAYRLILTDVGYPDGRKFCKAVLASCPSEFTADRKLIGSFVKLTGKCRSFAAASNPGQYDEAQYRKAYGFCTGFRADSVQIVQYGLAPIRQLLWTVKERLSSVFKKLFPKEEAGIVIAMLLGDRESLEPEVSELYKIGGISHILAISGLHLSLLGMGLYRLLRFLRCGQFLSSAFSVGLLLLYGMLTGFGVSTKRAFFLLSLLLLAKLLGCTADPLTSLSLAAVFILWKQPLLLFQAGFLLSFLAALGIVLLLPSFVSVGRDPAVHRPKPAALWNHILKEPLLASGLIQLITLPVTLYFFFEVSVYSVFLNLFVLPLLALLFGSIAAAGISGCFFLPLGTVFAGGAYFILKSYEFLCRAVAALPLPVLTLGRMNVPAMVLYYCILFGSVAFCRICQNKKPAVFLFFLLLPVFYHANEGVRVAFLDVGQGDCAVIEDGQGTVLLIDGGSSSVKQVGTYRILPYLKCRGIREVDYAFLSHADLDHTNGVVELVDQGVVKCLILPDTGDAEEVFADLIALAEKRGCSVRFLGAGGAMKGEEWQLKCFAPSDTDSFSAGENNGSMVLEFCYGNAVFYFTGDVEGEGEEALLRRLCEEAFGEGKIRVLKVAHHGSKYSTSQTFLQLLRPQAAVISCGRGNSYGHPHKELLRRIEESGGRMYQTPECGAVTVLTDKIRVRFFEFLK